MPLVSLWLSHLCRPLTCYKPRRCPLNLRRAPHPSLLTSPPYRPPVARFGNRITIERRLTHGTGNHWKLYNAAGKAVPEYKPAEVLRYMGVNACNPLTIITQDMARAFLSGAVVGGRCRYIDRLAEGRGEPVGLSPVQRKDVHPVQVWECIPFIPFAWSHDVVSFSSRTGSADDKRKKYEMFMEGTYLVRGRGGVTGVRAESLRGVLVRLSGPCMRYPPTHK